MVRAECTRKDTIDAKSIAALIDNHNIEVVTANIWVGIPDDKTLQGGQMEIVAIGPRKNIYEETYRIISRIKDTKNELCKKRSHREDKRHQIRS